MLFYVEKARQQMKIKRIIEIDEEEYKAVSELSEREKVNELSYYEKIIAQSTPYNPSGDLISREALKKAIEPYRYATDGVFGGISLIIDNAPTVGSERPKGEWGKWIVAEIQCPNCFKYFEVDYYSAEQLNKCPSCGADMRKVGAE